MITVLGEALIDLISAESGTYRPAPGGAPANTAVTLARLGIETSLLARLSHDKFGRQLRGYLGGRGVDLRDVITAPEPTTLAIATLDDTGSAEYSFYVKETADWQWRPEELPRPLSGDVSTLHAGSLALAVPPGAQVLQQWLGDQRHLATISYDPNIRPTLALDRATERRRVEHQIAMADIVKASDEDTEWLYPGLSTSAVARRWRELGPSVVVITRGDQESIGLVRDPAAAEVRRRPPRVEVVDTVGAGDAFAAGLLRSLGRANALGAESRDRLADLSAAELGECMAEAQSVAARACQRVGADPGVL